MICPNCGTHNQENAFSCTGCGSVLPQQPKPQYGAPVQNVPNYLVQSVLVTLLCCMPLGVPAIVFASQVNGKLSAGDYNGALDSSKKAKMFCWISFGIGLAVSLIYIVAIVLSIVFNSPSGGIEYNSF